MDLDTQICSNPIFVIGSPRSGTTVLAWSLASHSQLWTSGESYILWELFGNDRGRKSIDMIFKTAEVLADGSWLNSQNVGRDELLRCLGLGLNALFTSRSQGKRWIDHTPKQTLMVDILTRLFPDALFLHILRDGRHVVNSMIHFLDAVEDNVKANFENAGWEIPWIDFTEACRTWRDYVEVSMAFCGNQPDRCLTITHERLVADTASCFTEIFDFVGVPHEDEPIRFVQTRWLHSSFGSARLQDGEGGRPAEPWEEWTSDQKAIFMREAGPTLSKYGLAGEGDV